MTEVFRKVEGLCNRIGASICLLVVLVACSGGSARPAVDGGGAGPGRTILPLPMQPLTLTLWHPWSGRKEQALDSLARSFEQAHPAVRIRLESHPVASLVHDYAGHAADAGGPQLVLVRGRYVGELAASQHVLPLDTVVPTQTLTTLVPAALANGQVSGHPYGMPLSLDALVFWYDRRIVTHQPGSLAELLATRDSAVTVTPDSTNTATPAPAIKLAYYLSLVTTLPYLYALDGRLQTTGDALALSTAMRPAALRWLTGLQDLLSHPQAQANDDLAQIDRALQIGHAWSAIDWSYQGSEYEAIWGKEASAVGALPPASAGGKQPPTVVAADVLCVNPVTSNEQRAAAFSFIRYLLSDEAQTKLAKVPGVVPANNRALVDDATRALQAAITVSVAEPTMLDSRHWAVLNDMVRSVLTGNAGPAQALDAAGAQLAQASP